MYFTEQNLHSALFILGLNWVIFWSTISPGTAIYFEYSYMLILRVTKVVGTRYI